MQLKTAKELIDETRNLVGQVLAVQVYDWTEDRYRTRDYRIVTNDHVINLKSPEMPRVCLDVYAEAKDTKTGQSIYLSLDKLSKQRL